MYVDVGHALPFLLDCVLPLFVHISEMPSQYSHWGKLIYFENCSSTLGILKTSPHIFVQYYRLKVTDLRG